MINKGDLGGSKFFLSPNFNFNDYVYVNLDIDKDYNISVVMYRRCWICFYVGIQKNVMANEIVKFGGSNVLSYLTILQIGFQHIILCTLFNMSLYNKGYSISLLI